MLNLNNDIDTVVREMCDYWTTYANQKYHKSYENKTIIEDMLYSIAISMNPEYRFASGFRKFKDDLKSYLDQ